MNKETCAFGYFEWEDSRLITFTVTTAKPEIADLKEYCESYKKIVDSLQGPYVFVFDSTLGKWLPSSGWVEMGKVANELETRYVDRNKVNIMVIPSLVINNILKGINLMSKPQIPQRVFKTREAAMEAAQQEIAGW